jgi:5-oxoprolinase (ATP-hydrolysing) subunit A
VRIDLNADVGEWTGDDPARETDARLMAFVTTVNIACGAHAGDARTLAITAELAAARGLAIGAHPGYPDREGFGRRRLELTTDELRTTLHEQIEALADACEARGARLTHVKAHGALYHAAATDPELAHVVAGVVRRIDDRLALFGPPGSALLDAARDTGLRGVAEGFADRTYEPDGSLRARSLEDAVLTLPALVASQALDLAVSGMVAARGIWLDLSVETICLHGDSPNVVASARAVRNALDAVDVEARPFHTP